MFDRKIDEIIIHCTLTLPNQPVDIPTLRAWHIAKGLTDIAYHFVIGIDGEYMAGRPLDVEGAHCYWHNAHSIAVAYIGGLDHNGRPSDTRTRAQKLALIQLITFLRLIFPDAKVYGHSDFANTVCPCFDVRSDYNLLFN